ncbi:MAG TPA: UvrD-helicase domain-containing protein [Tepidisphaeraceae bacterium]|nr:UvrD-helicase domain-containing protein [Tepidisphaeraceae bacterium]
MLNAEHLLEDLTAPQREAATHIDGPLLIIAGAGSGKTRVITRRVAYLLAQGIPAWRILAITFTNKAAGEMKSRVAGVIDRPLRDFGRLDQPWPLICTFHSLCLRILRHYAVRIGLPNNFSIYDTSDQNKLIKEAIKMLDVSSANFSPSTVHGTISNAKNKLIDADAFARSAGDFYQKTVARIFTKYQKLLNQNNALDFDDLLLKTAHALRAHPDMLAELQERFQYLLIDEYQDTNHAQYVLAHALALRHKNLCVVGDPDQSIYAWRGADIQIILDFEKDYPDAKVIRLEQNYRSTKRILRIASTLIARNTQRKDKTLWTENADGEPAAVFFCQDEHDEAAAVMNQLKSLHDKHKYDWSQMAIFYRMNALSRVMEDALRNANVPYQIARGVEFYNRKEIKDALAYLRIVANPADEVSLTRIANVPTRGLSDATLKTLSLFAATRGVSLWEAMAGAGSVPGISARAANAAGQFTKMVEGWRRMAYGAGSEPVAAPAENAAIDEFLPMPAEFESPELEDSAYVDDVEFDPPPPADPNVLRGHVRDIAERVIRQSGLEDFLRKTGGDELDELHNVEELISSTAEFDKANPQGSLHDYLAQVSLVSDADHMKGAGGAVTLMTLHAAKGLEFPVVAMIALEDGILPHSRSRGNQNEMEEERRLCFVGITRAQERIIFSKAARRTIRGVPERTIPSPFLHEMPADDLKINDRTGAGSSGRSTRSANASPGAGRDPHVTPFSPRQAYGQFSHLRSGQRVRHPQFGIGRICEVEEMSEQRTRAVVQFTTAGQKTLILEFARLEVIE